MKTPEERRSEAVIRARQLYGEGKFRRNVRKRLAYNLISDVLVLDCGHSTSTITGLGDQPKPDDTANCLDCYQAWVDAEVNKFEGK